MDIFKTYNEYALYIYKFLLSICISYDMQYDTIHGKKKIDTQYDSRFDNYESR